MKSEDNVRRGQLAFRSQVPDGAQVASLDVLIQGLSPAKPSSQPFPLNFFVFFFYMYKTFFLFIKLN